MRAAASPSSRSSTGGRPLAFRPSTRCSFSRGRRAPAISLCTRHTSAALQTLGREHLAFSRMFSAMSKSASLSTYTWQMPVPVSMTGTVALSTQARMSPAPPRGMSRSTRPEAVISSTADCRDTSCTSPRASWGSPAAASPSRRADTMTAAERWASLPQRSTQADPAFSVSAAASEVTLGRLS